MKKIVVDDVTIEDWKRDINTISSWLRGVTWALPGRSDEVPDAFSTLYMIEGHLARAEEEPETGWADKKMESNVTLTLTRREALVLSAVMNNIGGSRTRSLREETDNIKKKLSDKKIEVNVISGHLSDGSIVFRDDGKNIEDYAFESYR